MPVLTRSKRSAPSPPPPSKRARTQPSPSPSELPAAHREVSSSSSEPLAARRQARPSSEPLAAEDDRAATAGDEQQGQPVVQVRWNDAWDRQLLLLVMNREVDPTDYATYATRFPGVAPRAVFERLRELRREQSALLIRMPGVLRPQAVLTPFQPTLNQPIVGRGQLVVPAPSSQPAGYANPDDFGEGSAEEEEAEEGEEGDGDEEEEEDEDDEDEDDDDDDEGEMRNVSKSSYGLRRHC